MRRASLAAVNEPNVIKTDKLRSYEQAIDDVFPFAKYIKSEGLRAEININRLDGYKALTAPVSNPAVIG